MMKKLGFGTMRLPLLDPNDNTSVDMEQFKKEQSDQYNTAIQWMADDIKFMSTGK